MNDLKKMFETDPRSYILTLVDEGFVTAEHALECFVVGSSTDSAKWIIDNNELSPRFFMDDEDDEDESADDEDDENESADDEDDPRIWRRRMEKKIADRVKQIEDRR